MKKLIAFLFSIFLSVQLFAQSTPVGEFRVTDRNTVIGFNIPAGSKIIALADSSYWVAKEGVLGSITINQALSSLVRINKPETDPIVRAIYGVVMSDGTTIKRVKSGTNIVTINGDSLLRSGNITLPTLDEGGKIPLSQINDVLLGAVNYKGTWSAVSNAPTLPAAATENKGWYYIATDSAAYGGEIYRNKDWIVSNGAAWQKVDNNNMIASVFGRVGNVTATTYDIIQVGNRYYITPADTVQLDNLVSNLAGKQTTSLADGKILVGNSSNLAAAVTPSGDVAITNAGAMTVSNAAGNMRVVGTLKIVGSSNDATPDSILTIAGGVVKTTAVSLITVTASNITGVLAVTKGGTGNITITPGSIPQGYGENPMSERTLDQLKNDVGAADMGNYGSLRVDFFAETSGTPTPHALTNYPASAASVQVAVNGSVLEPGKYILANKTVTLDIPTYNYDKVVVTYAYDYSGDAAYADKWYGVERDITSSSVDWTRIGNLALHQTTALPVQSLLKGVVLNANRTVNYYLLSTDWTKKADNSSSVLTGADGNVMVRKDAATYWKFEQVGNIQRVKCSIYPIPGFLKFDTWNVGAYEAYLNGSSKLSSYKGVMPTTSRSLTQFRIDARANGAGYNQMWNEPYNEIVWMAVVEYATTNFQKAVTADAGGLRQGGLGDGVTTAGGEWATYNSYNPFITCGASDALANGSGQVSVTISNFGGAGVNRSFNVPRYRGIENWFGHIWKWTDGKSFNHTATASEVWIFDNPDLIADNTSVGARFAGYLPAASGYISNVLFGARGETLPSVATGDASTYFADYFWTPGYGSGWKALVSGAAADVDVSSGPFAAFASNGASNANASIGARLFAK